ncbi:hypothetical protein F0P96_09100 [Hymenobacter busanensis]|uniref:Uncharacterized protein n=1 Tax=Hymenobacter busanensis TaxID=2607656 RepID=A0A7L4ZY92_9BACT|nr:hypothetical protein [Hymenobacter busanensis]KAA9333127.1 hypothetical protein F0P96_09100 [Hymenobacter busanensis]QHJ08198.1 hypothetical protein GUY19_13225 [Hymenobacter busanensis]
MQIPFQLNLNHQYADQLYNEHGRDAGQEAIAELEDKIGAAIGLVVQRHGVLPGVGDRVHVEQGLIVVIDTRSFEEDGNIWYAVRPFGA